jgi:hypothetical protein
MVAGPITRLRGFGWTFALMRRNPPETKLDGLTADLGRTVATAEIAAQ